MNGCKCMDIYRMSSIFSLSHANHLPSGTAGAHDCCVPDPHRHTRCYPFGPSPCRPAQLCTDAHRNAHVFPTLTSRCSTKSLDFYLDSICNVLFKISGQNQAKPTISSGSPAVPEEKPWFGAKASGTQAQSNKNCPFFVV